MCSWTSDGVFCVTWWIFAGKRVGGGSVCCKMERAYHRSAAKTTNIKVKITRVPV